MRHPDGGHPEFAPDPHDHLQQGGVEVEMFVSVHVVEDQARLGERRELRPNLRLELPPQ